MGKEMLVIDILMPVINILSNIIIYIICSEHRSARTC